MTVPGPGSLPRRALIDPQAPPPASVPSGAGDDWLRQLDWRQFEHLVGTAFSLQGYAVQATADGADGGIDLILTRGEERIFVQCKHWRAYQVGVKTVRELLGVVVAHGATAGIVVTSGSYTAEAIAFGHQGRITLLNGRALNELLAIGRISPDVPAIPPLPAPLATQAPATAFALADGGMPACPICRSPMALRKARRGRRAGSSFWGCSRYPGCKGVREVDGWLQPPLRLVATRARTGPGERVLRALFGLGIGFLAVVMLLTLLPLLFSTFAGSMAKPVRLAPSGPASAAKPAADLGEQPMDLALDPRHARLYSANFVSGDVSVIDSATMVAIQRIDVPGKPTGVAVDPSSQRVYVSDYAGKLHVADGKSGELITTIDVGGKPADVALDSERHRLFVANTDDETVEVIDTRTNKHVGKLKSLGVPSAVAVDGDDGSLFVSASFAIWRYQEPTGRQQRQAQRVSSNGSDLAIDAARQRLYVLHRSTIVDHNLTTGNSVNLDSGGAAAAICLDEANRIAYLADPDMNRIWALPLP